jgi:hypothetical protein
MEILKFLPLLVLCGCATQNDLERAKIATGQVRAVNTFEMVGSNVTISGLTRFTISQPVDPIAAPPTVAESISSDLAGVAQAALPVAGGVLLAREITRADDVYISEKSVTTTTTSEVK